MTRLGPSELARALGVSRQQVYDYRKDGKITAGADGKFDPDQVAIDLGRNLKAKMGGESRGRDRQEPVTAETPAPVATIRPIPPAPPGEDDEYGPDYVSLVDAQRRKEIAIARMRELAVDRLEGKLVEAEDVVKVWDRHIDQVKNRLLLAIAKFPPCCRPIADKEFRAALEDLSEIDPDAE
jgi:hypothetical protein